MRKKENPSTSKPPNCSLYLKAAELVLLFQSHRIALVPLPQNDIVRSSSEVLNLLDRFTFNISFFTTRPT